MASATSVFVQSAILTIGILPLFDEACLWLIVRFSPVQYTYEAAAISTVPILTPFSFRRTLRN